MTAVLFLITLSRLPRLLAFTMDGDEVWSVWQTLGALDQTLGWVPYDWPPLHYVMVWLWSQFTGIQPLTERFLSFLIFLIGAACMFRAGRRLLGSDPAGWIAALGYAAFGFTIYLSVLVRGYVIVYALTPLTLWLTLRYFERPGWRRGIGLGVVMAALFYTHFTAILVFGIIGLLAVTGYGRRVLDGWRPGLIAALIAAPLIVQKLSLVSSRLEAVGQVQQPPFLPSLVTWYADFFGAGALVWAVGGVICLGLVLFHRRKLGVALLVWVAFPVFMLALNARIGFFSLRHLAWVGVGIALVVAGGVRFMPRIGRVMIGAALVIGLFLPFPAEKYLLYGSVPALETLTWLAGQWREGDVVYLDPVTRPGSPELWDYFGRVYFPRGLPMVTVPDGYRRVWFASVDGAASVPAKTRLEKGRLAGRFVGPWNFLIRLYEAPSDPVGVRFDNGLRFHGYEVLNRPTPGYLVAHENEVLTIRAWWSVDQALDKDYSLTLQLLNDGGDLIAQSQDRAGSPETPKETSRWQPGMLYAETLTIQLPENMYQRGAFAHQRLGLFLTVYQWWDGVRVSGEGTTTARLLPVGTLDVTAW